MEIDAVARLLKTMSTTELALLALICVCVGLATLVVFYVGMRVARTADETGRPVKERHVVRAAGPYSPAD
jgi:hypothetical protein